VKERQVSLVNSNEWVRSNSTEVVELGAGAALPSLLLSTLPNPPSLLVVTDHPDEVIFDNLNSSVMRNEGAVDPKCRVVAIGYDWGTNPSTLLFVPFL
jgi:nicotinamide N-methyltransferase